MSFFFRHGLVLAPWAPLLFVPFLSDALTAALIAQEQLHGRLSPLAAARQALLAMPRFIRLKMWYYVRALGWGLIPVYGVIRDIDERLAWAMSSNVAVIEGQASFAGGATRCETLVTSFRAECTRVLATIPLVLLVPLLVMLVLTKSTSEWWAIVLVLAWFWFPASGAANTYLYFWICGREKQRSRVNPARVLGALPPGPYTAAYTSDCPRNIGKQILSQVPL